MGQCFALYLHFFLLLLFSDMQDRLEMFASEEDLENASLYEPSSYVGVVFLDSSATSYRLRFPYSQLPLPSDYTESIGKVLTGLFLTLLYLVLSPFMYTYKTSCVDFHQFTDYIPHNDKTQLNF